MKIAQVAPLWERVPPPNYGGTELVVSRLTDELVRRGHNVTLFASGDSQILARLEAVCPGSLRSQSSVKDYAAYELMELSQVYEQAGEFDLIHSHVGIAALAIAPLVTTLTLHTLHGDFTPDHSKLFIRHRQQPYISISNAQRQLDLNYVQTVYNGIDLQDYPFGLVMIESMATGTPVIGMNLGSVLEVIAHGKTGFVCQSYIEMAAMIPAAMELDRQLCRNHIENKFSVTQMVDGYEAASQKLLASRIKSNGYLYTSKVVI